MRDRQLTLVVAAAGYGKTAWAESHLPPSSLVLRAPDRPAALVGPGVEPTGVCVDDLHLLSSRRRGPRPG